MLLHKGRCAWLLLGWQAWQAEASCSLPVVSQVHCWLRWVSHSSHNWIIQNLLVSFQQCWSHWISNQTWKYKLFLHLVSPTCKVLIWTGVPVPFTVFFLAAFPPFPSACSALAIRAFSASTLLGLFSITWTTAYSTREANPKSRQAMSHTSSAFT